MSKPAIVVDHMSMMFNLNKEKVDNIKEYFAADSLVTPIALAVVIVIPERETPGIKAKACDRPIKNVCFSVMSSYFIVS